MEINNKGQTLVEYILLLAVAVSLVMTLVRSQAFKRVFGDQGRLGASLKSQGEFSYRHAFFGNGPDREFIPDVPTTNRNISIHPSYVEPGVGTRFFGPKEPYGQ